MMINNFFTTLEQKASKQLLNKAISNQISCKGLLDNCRLGESRG